MIGIYSMQLSIYREVNSITEWIIRYHMVSSYPILRSFPKTQFFFDKNQVFFPKLKKNGFLEKDLQISGFMLR